MSNTHHDIQINNNDADDDNDVNGDDNNNNDDNYITMTERRKPSNFQSCLRSI